MDRSFLSQPEIVDASRRFICIRLATYEHKEEAEFLKTIFLGRTGQLENTVFAILSPDGKRKLSRTGRSPDFAFRSGLGQSAQREMASTMDRIAGSFAAKKTMGEDLPLPAMGDFRLALNVASCDNQPLVVLLAKDEQTRSKLERRLRPLAWSKEFIGQFHYITAKDKKELSTVDGVKIDSGIIIVQPGEFGQDGDATVSLPADVSDKELERNLHLSVLFRRLGEKDYRSHIAEGRRSGVQWKTLLPVTDPGPPRGRDRPRRR